ncbi:SRPBCC family protein [Nocardia sp. BSTN01]|uniref:type II toxin-antitoxin system Rv0910 family toxin n=1 Tax=Nocardia sp. BSTN01 TaxID=2783665 RepID=UPI00188F1915|nr:SRPBCC family protein [Nocardia sp. BSTN01]MBF5001743.1 SRPBCC family protein [Nocardia sp. BSTN01]
MAKLTVSVEVPIPPDRAWSHGANLGELDQWLIMHEAWRGRVPDELTPGTELVGIASVKGLRNRVRWTVRTAEPPRRLVLSGAGKGGTTLGLALLVAPNAAGSAVTVDIDLGGRPLFGPIGATVARALRGDIERSLGRFVDLYC